MPSTESRILRLRGDHDVSTAGALSKLLARTIALDDANLVVDLDRVTFMDVATVGVILRAERLLAAQSRSLVLRSPPRLARRVLELCGLGRLIQASDDAASLRTWVAVPAMVPSLVPDREGP